MYICKFNVFNMEQIQIYQDNVAVSRVVVGDGVSLDGDLGSCLRPYKHVFVVFDRAAMLKSYVLHELIQKFVCNDIPVKGIEATEASKTIDTVMDICSWLLDVGADRDALVLAVGGGITTDMTGFAASIYKRGVRYANLPTTLLAQVDAAIGGKTGVNYEKYKNMLGVIRQPEFTYLCAQVLESLPRRDFLSGAAEMLKTFVIEDEGMYARAVSFLKLYTRNSEKTLEGCIDELRALITAAARVKAGVVSRDQFEQGERRVLNLGHTFAHAIETLAQRESPVQGYPALSLNGANVFVTHGEAVTVGMVLAAKLSDEQRGDGTEGLAERLETDLKECGLSTACPYSVADMAEIMRKDKKAEGGKVHFVLPRDIGKVEIVDLSVDEVVRLMK